MRELAVVQIIQLLNNFIQVTDKMKRKLSQVNNHTNNDKQNVKKCRLAISRRQIKSRHATKIQSFWRCYRFLRPINNLEDRNPKDTRKQILYYKGKIVCCPLTLESIPVHDLCRVRFFSPRGMQVVAYTKSTLKTYFETTQINSTEFTCPLTTRKIRSDSIKNMGIVVSLEEMRKSFKETQAAAIIACLDSTLQDMLDRIYNTPGDDISIQFVNNVLVPQWDNDIEQLNAVDPQFTIDKLFALYTTLTERLKCKNTSDVVLRSIRAWRMKILGDYQSLFYNVNMTFPDPPNTVLDNDKYEQEFDSEFQSDMILN